MALAHTVHGPLSGEPGVMYRQIVADSMPVTELGLSHVRLMRDANIGVRRLATANAVEPILQVRQRAVTAGTDVDVWFWRQRSCHIGRVIPIDRQMRSIDLQRPTITAELETAIDPFVVGALVAENKIDFMRSGETER